MATATTATTATTTTKTGNCFSATSTMKGLAKLRPFVGFCQFVGFIPYHMEINEETRTLKRFSFSWRCPLTWWYFTLQIAGLAATGFTYQQIFRIFSTRIFNNVLYENHDTITKWYFVVTGLKTLDFIIVRFFIIRFNQLNKAVELLKKIDETLPARWRTHEDTVTLRVYIGIASMIILVISKH